MQKIELELVRGCNISCTWCPVDEKRNYRLMDMDFAVKILKQISKYPVGRERLRLFGGGEPFLYPKLKKLFETIREMDIHNKTLVDIYTNGMLLGKKNIQWVVESDVLGELVISVDGYGTKESYEFCRKGAKWDLLKRNVEMLTEALQKHGSRTKVRFETVVPNIDAYPNEEEPTMKEIKANFKREFPGIDIKYRKIHRYDGKTIKEGMPEKKTEKGICSRVHMNWVSITYEGFIRICCADINGTSLIGDLNKDTVLDAWNSKTYREIRKRLVMGDLPDLCKHCDLIRTDKEQIKKIRKKWFLRDYILYYLHLPQPKKVGF